MWGFAWQNLVTRPSRTALAAVGLTIPVLAFLGLFSISQGIRKLVGRHTGHDAGADGPAREFAEPGVQRPARGHGQGPAADPGRARRRPRGLEDRPPIDGRGGLGAAAVGLLGRPRESGLKNLAKMILIEGQDLPEHLKLKGAVFADVDLAQGTRRGTVPRPE